MKKSWTWIVCGVFFAGTVVVVEPASVQARSNYTKSFQKLYPALDDVGGSKCTVCHFGEKKSNINDYATAVSKHLEVRNVKDVEKIEAALKKAEEDPSSIEGKTFGDLIKEGKLPGKPQ